MVSKLDRLTLSDIGLNDIINVTRYNKITTMKCTSYCKGKPVLSATDEALFIYTVDVDLEDYVFEPLSKSQNPEYFL